MKNEVAETIRQQLGPVALALLGASNLVATTNETRENDGLMFRVGRNAKGVSKLVIRLDPSDTYTVQAWRLRGADPTLLEEVSDVYVDSLHDVIERLTGLYTRF